MYGMHMVHAMMHCYAIDILEYLEVVICSMLDIPKETEHRNTIMNPILATRTCILHNRG